MGCTRTAATTCRISSVSGGPASSRKMVAHAVDSKARAATYLGPCFMVVSHLGFQGFRPEAGATV